ncbi:MAG: cellobiose transport system permease protein [Actinomycetota bacterium]|nr:cellobiose transport system permease protein [Actinomycetota bacterium]
MSAPSVDEVDPATGPPGPPAVIQRSEWRSRLTRFDMKYAPYFMIAPFFIVFGFFGLFPLLYNGVVSLQRYRLDDESSNGWTGLDNYSLLFSDSEFWMALRNTFGLFLFSSMPQMLAALFLAAALNRQLRARTLLRMGVLLPYITPIAATAVIFNQIFAKEYGLVNALLGWMGKESRQDWGADTWSSWLALIVQIDWRWTGYWAVIFLAAMQSISKDLYEAATVDGAGPWRQFWQITVPMIRPAIVFAMVMTTIGGLQLFTEPLLFGDNVANAYGGSLHQFETISLYIYRTGWLEYDLGYAAAMSWALFVIIVVVAGINAALTNRIGGRK